MPEMSTALDDVDTAFLRAWTDQRATTSCGLWQDATDLGAAHTAKFARLADLAGVRSGARVLDVGCGSGGLLEYLAVRRDAVAVGVDRSARYCRDAASRSGVIDVECADYRDYAPAERFDAVVCAQLLEHTTRYSEARAGRHLERYRDFFQRLHDWTRRGAKLALEVLAMPDIRWATPSPAQQRLIEGVGGHRCFVRPSDLGASCLGLWQPTHSVLLRDDAVRTHREWLRRLTGQREELHRRWGTDLVTGYERVLRHELDALHSGTAAVALLGFRRIDPR
ncbi:SAM-dependent methyltransferase [Saccharopolyspora sp. CA-218241]|uniref:SAM-dependent methyltransferase n=1 Tax=Saccharopolyspora sp. CA-218241 TaxID=3240027 RepID=UPI003D99DFCA